MFCFIDQMPPGMRDTLYFKDDDTRLSFLQGNYGAGMGATVGKYMGRERSMKSGIGAYAVQLGELKVGAVVTLNALGDIYDIDTDKKIAGALDENGLLFDDETAYFEAAAKIQNMFTGNTTIGTIITNAKLDKTALNKVASMAHNGYGRAIRPVHTMADGDSIYAVSVGSVPADINLVGPMSAYVMAKAIANAARSAKSVDGYKAFGFLPFSSGETGNTLAITANQANRWTPREISGDASTENPNAMFPRLSYGNDHNSTQPSTFWKANARYLRLQEINLNYNLSAGKILKQLGVSSLDLQFVASNICVWSPFKHFDPEQAYYNGGAYPIPARYAFQMYINF